MKTQSATIITADGETEILNIFAGVLQCDTLAPFLLIVVLDYVFRFSLDSINEKGITINLVKAGDTLLNISQTSILPTI